ncbi:MAG: DNA alkylation repair protein [Fibrobacter sp.]|nr:DNA alkylation repair protein [Fibrobacter sp.]
MSALLKELYAAQDKTYAAFQAKLLPTIPAENIIGVRVPDVRKLAKKYAQTTEAAQFFKELPHKHYDENMLHGLLLAEIKDIDECIQELNRFLPFVDNWAVCDILSPKVFKKNKDLLIQKIREWATSSHTYTCRFGLEMLMTYFLDEDFKKEYLKIPIASAKLYNGKNDYYMNMMIAWFFATALAKQWDSTLPYLEKQVLEPWTHNKTIQKAIESYRISDEKKAYLRTLKTGKSLDQGNF